MVVFDGIVRTKYIDIVLNITIKKVTSNTTAQAYTQAALLLLLAELLPYRALS